MFKTERTVWAMKWKDRRLWICVLLYGAIIWLLSWLGEWGDPRATSLWYVAFQLPIPMVWVTGLYWKWSGKWTREDNVPWAVLLTLVNLPYFPVAVVGLGPWLCPVGSVIVGMGCAAIKKKCG